MAWFAVKVFPGREARVAAGMGARLAVAGRDDVRVLVPLQREIAPTQRRTMRGPALHRWRKRRPGFVFVRAAKLDAELLALLHVRGAGCVEGPNGEPRPLPERVAAALDAGSVGAPGFQRLHGRRGREPWRAATRARRRDAAG